MIIEAITRITKRLSDVVIHGRNKAMILVGTDRKDTTNSGYGDGGENEVDSAAIDIVVGYDADQVDPNLTADKSRIYLSEMSDPDDYFDVSVGDAVQAEPCLVGISDNVYLKSRSKIKILNGNVSILINENGEIEISAESNATLKVGESSITIDQAGNIELNAGQGIDGFIVTDLDQPIHIDPITGSPVRASFERPPGIPVANRKVKIK